MSTEAHQILKFPCAPKKRTKPTGRVLPLPLRWADALHVLSTCRHEQATTKGSRRRAAQRDEIVLHLGLYLGLRVSEMCYLNIEDFDFESCTCFIHQGKGAKDRVVPFACSIVPVFREFAKGRSGLLLVNCHNKIFNPRVIHHRIARLGKMAGLDWLHPHTLRHAAALRLLNTGSHIRKIQKFLGHADIRVTSVYLDLEPVDLRDDVNKM